MANVISFNGIQRGGSYADIINFLNAMARTYGSTANATAVLLRKSREYKTWAKQANKHPKAG